ncbi:MAG TPA: branched-chain amino acid ABC transporter permease [Syntrophorhabdales bacterium]|nr:branched-chain amino acid ABC transporter permease [Syntrophorhabdales bacterium]
MFKKFLTPSNGFWLIALIGLLFVPKFVDPYWVVFLLLLFMYIGIGSSFNITAGYLGYVNLGHYAFFGISAYGFAILYAKGVPFVICMATGVVVTLIFATLISYPFLRLKGGYFALANFGLIKLFELVAGSLRDFTGGTQGISLTPGYRPYQTYYMFLAVALLTVIVCYWIPKSKFGLALFSIREDEEVAEAFGINVNRRKMAAYILSSAFPALLGAGYAWYSAYIDPEVVFGTDKALLPVTMVMLGGTGTFLGPIFGAVFMLIIEEFLWTSTWLPVWIKSLHLTMLGLILASVGIFSPGGLVTLSPMAAFFRKVGMGRFLGSSHKVLSIE